MEKLKCGKIRHDMTNSSKGGHPCSVMTNAGERTEWKNEAG